MTFSPRVAIVLATYRPNLDFLGAQLKSIRDQSLRDWFLILHNDGDDSFPETEKLAQTILGAEKVLALASHERRGSVGNFSAALEHVPPGFDLIAYCDQDDIWEKNKLEVLADEFSDPDVWGVHCDLSLIDGIGRVLHPSCWQMEARDVLQPTIEKIIVRNSVTGCALVFRRELLASILPIPRQDVRAPFFHHDAWTALHILAHGQLRAQGSALVRYRQHGGNVVGAEALKSGRLQLGEISGKCLRAVKTRIELERAWNEASETHQTRLFARRDFGARLFLRLVAWSLTSSGYWRIGLQLVLGKFLWDWGQRVREPRLESGH